MIILLDLNYTLVANSTEKKRPFAMQIQHEKYREWLVSLVAPYHTILMTARPEMHRQATLDSIYFKVGWTPQEAFFNRYHKPPHDAKRIMLEQHVLPRWQIRAKEAFARSLSSAAYGRALWLFSASLPDI